MAPLHKARVAILATEGFERSELEQPLRTFREHGSDVDIIALGAEPIRSWDEADWGDPFTVDVAIDEARIEDYDALILPGGTINPDRLRRDERAVRFVREFVASGKPVAAICHAPWMLAEADVLLDRRATSFPSIRTDVTNAGAAWVDAPVVIDGNLITSRSPADLPAFIAAIERALEAIVTSSA